MKKILSLLAVAAMAFTACTTDITEDIVKNETGAYSVPLEFAVEQGETRAFMDDDVTIQFEEGDVIGVYVTPADASKEATKNAKFTISLKNGILTAGGQVASFAAGDTVMAYYPYDATNDTKEASAVLLSNDNVQIQEDANNVSLKGMPMVSVATALESVTEGTILFRPVASVIKLNIYSSDEADAGIEIRRVVFNVEKYFNVTGSNIVSGRLRNAGFDLTSVTEDSEIVVAPETRAAYNAPYGEVVSFYQAHRVCVDYINRMIVSTDKNSAYMVVFPGNYGGYKCTVAGDVVTNPTTNACSNFCIYTDKGRFTMNVTENYEFGRGMIRPFSLDLQKAKHESNEITAETLRKNAATTGTGWSNFLDEELVVIASGSECDNVATNPFNNSYRITKDNNSLNAFAQTLDGKYGFRLEFDEAASNTLKRGDKLELFLGGATVYKVENPTHYYIKVTAENLSKITPNCEADIVEKVKTIAELADEDIYTEVTLKDVEAVIKKTVKTGSAAKTVLDGEGYNHPAPWTNGFESNYKLNNDNTYLQQSEVMPSMLQDTNNDAIMVLINPECGDWRRNVGVPQGYGNATGVIVHETSKFIGDYATGNIGKYQFRPYDGTSFEDISDTAADATKVIALWSLTKATNSINYYYFTCTDEGCLGTKRASGYQEGSTKVGDKVYEAGLVPQNKMWATHGELTNGTALLYSSNLAYINKRINFWYNSATYYATNNSTFPVAIHHGLKSTSTVRHAKDDYSQSTFTSIQFPSKTAGFYEWNGDAWTGKTNGFIVEFPGSSATGKTAVSFALAPNGGNKLRGAVFGFPLYWKVECSVDDGNTWVACTNAITGDANGYFDMHQINFYVANCGWDNPLTGDNKVPTANSDMDVYFGTTPTGTFAPSGYPLHKFILPESAQGAGKIMVKISPRDTQLAWPAEGKWNTSLTATNLHATPNLDHGLVYHMEDVMVTTVK